MWTNYGVVAGFDRLSSGVIIAIYIYPVVVDSPKASKAEGILSKKLQIEVAVNHWCNGWVYHLAVVSTHDCKG